MSQSTNPENITIHEITELNLREVFAREDHVFTPWLAAPPNLARLAKALGMELELLQVEASTGTFRTDILAKRSADDAVVVIENQFRRSDHDHLGKALTYLAAHDAAAVVWLAESFADEHRAVLEWLNDNTPEGIGFFGVIPRLIKIGDSAPGLRFELEVKPNTFVKQTRATDRTISEETKTIRAEFWKTFLGAKAQSAILAPAATRYGGALGFLWIIPLEQQYDPHRLHVLVYINAPAGGPYAVSIQICCLKGAEAETETAIADAATATAQRIQAMGGAPGALTGGGSARWEVDLATEAGRAAAISMVLPFVEAAFQTVAATTPSPTTT